MIRALFIALLLLAVNAGDVQAQSQLGDTAGATAYRFYDTPIKPDRYLIRPGDILTVTFIGTQIAPLTLTVDAEGQVVHSTLGVFDMRGKTLSEVRTELDAAMGRLYRAEKIVISVGKPRLVGIRVGGSVVKPGLYAAYTSQRVSELIDSAGGVLPGGSRRLIRLEGGPEDVPVDLDRARYLGESGFDPAVYGGYAVIVPPRSDQIVNVVGEVARPCEIEFVQGETVADLIALAGGLKATADSAKITVIRGTGQMPVEGVELSAGDIVFVPLQRGPEAEEGVTVFGAVQIPGRQPIDETSTLAAVISAAGGFLPTAAPSELTVFRKVPIEAVSRAGNRYAIGNLVDPPQEIRPFPLHPGDSIFVPLSVGYVMVSGEVYNPGMFPYESGKSVGDYVRAAGGFLPTAEKSAIDLLHRVSRMTTQITLDVLAHDGDEIIVRRREELR